VWDGVEAKLFSRNGKVFEVGGVFNEGAARLMDIGEVWDGELLFFEGGKALDRKTSNGIANKALKGTLSKEEAFKAVFVCWDDVDFSGKVDYFDRLSILQKRFDNVDTVNFQLCNSVVVNNEEEAYEFFNEMLKNGEEGAILKNLDFKWEPKRVKGVGKMKALEEADLKIVGWEEGTGRNKGLLGALVCETACGQMKVNIGTGFSDDQRKSITEEVIGKIVTVQYNQVVDSKGKDTKSLFLPRFVEIREDKDVANKLEELK
jgi:ATP-dependent DNA ligase